MTRLKNTKALDPNRPESDTRTTLRLTNRADQATLGTGSPKAACTCAVQSAADPANEQSQPRRITWNLPGFDRRCRVSTRIGDLPIEALRLHDQVKTRSGAYLAVTWIDAIRVDANFMARHPEAHPMYVPASVIGPGQPVRDMLLSPGQPFGTSERATGAAHAPALEFDGHSGIRRIEKTEITYFRFHCDAPTEVQIDGAWFHVAP